jgi:hypothetical protein
MRAYFGKAVGEFYLDCMVKVEDEHYCRGAVFLHFVRSNNDFVLSRVELLNIDIAAMFNERPPF